MFTIAKNHIHLLVTYCNKEVFLLSDLILTAYDFCTRTLASTEATLANDHMKGYAGGSEEEELKGFFRNRGWQVLAQ